MPRINFPTLRITGQKASLRCAALRFLPAHPFGFRSYNLILIKILFVACHRPKGILAAWALCSFSVMAQAPSDSASGIQPELSVLLLSEDEGQAQMALKNLDSTPLLLHTRIIDVPEDKSLVVIPLPPVIRMEPKSRQIVRFVLEKSAEPMTVQHYKRVTFEGIPAVSKNRGTSVVRVNVRYDLPVIISPKGLAQVENPWEQLQWKLEGRTLTVHNPSPFVVRMSREVDLMPQVKRVEALQRTFLLPGDTMSTELPGDMVPEELTAVRSFPASLYGAAVAPYDAVLVRPSIR